MTEGLGKLKLVRHEWAPSVPLVLSTLINLRAGC
jgi:hypothetical protein